MSEVDEAQVLVGRRALHLLEQPGVWCQHVFVERELGSDRVQRCCVGGAISCAVDEVRSRDAADRFLSTLLGQLGRRARYHRYEQIGDWNDAPGRTHEEILAAVRAALAYLTTSG